MQEFGNLDGGKLCSGLFSDCLDTIGAFNNVGCGLKPFNTAHKAFGRARTIKIVEAEGEPENIELGLSFLESLRPGEVLCVEGSSKFAYFGELMSRLSMRGKVGGIVIDGLTRDSAFVASCDLPVFYRGLSSVDIKGRGKVLDVDVHIKLCGLEIEPLDLIFADNDSVVRIPKEKENEAIVLIKDMFAEEEQIISRLSSGQPISEILRFHKQF